MKRGAFALGLAAVPFAAPLAAHAAAQPRGRFPITLLPGDTITFWTHDPIIEDHKVFAAIRSADGDLRLTYSIRISSQSPP